MESFWETCCRFFSTLTTSSRSLTGVSYLVSPIVLRDGDWGARALLILPHPTGSHEVPCAVRGVKCEACAEHTPPAVPVTADLVRGRVLSDVSNILPRARTASGESTSCRTTRLGRYELLVPQAAVHSAPPGLVLGGLSLQGGAQQQRRMRAKRSATLTS